MTLNKKGSTIVIVLALVAIFSTLGLTLLMSNSQADKERKFYIQREQVLYTALSGITHAFHKLKDIEPKDLDFDEIEGSINKNDYIVELEKNSSNPNIINIVCTAKKGNITVEKTAKAIFKIDRRITLNTSYLCKEEITKLWSLSYK